MCIIIGKYFPDRGWVGIKNRDRNYIPEISFHKSHRNGQEIVYFWDDITKYCEGLNQQGIAVLSASLMVLDDEKEIEKRSKQPSKDGIKIKKALTFTSIQDVVKSLITQKLPGNTLIFNKENMYLLEGAWQPGGYKDKKYSYKLKKIPHDEVVVRTNHGIMLPWAGYQKGDNKNQTLSRISSESRKLIAQWVAANSTTAEDVLDNLTHDFTGNGQLNAFRTTTAKKKMRTTSQILIVPGETTMYLRPVQSHIHFNFWDFNHPEQKIWVELLSNRALYHNVNPDKTTNKIPLQGRLNHES